MINTQFSAKKRQLQPRNTAKEAEILIYDQIGLDWFGGGVDAAAMVKEIGQIKADTLHVRLNSPGGEVFGGYSIYNALKRFSGEVIVHVDGIAASIASVIAMAGGEIRMGEGAFLMIHDPSSIVWGTAEDMRKMAEALDKIRDSVAGTYVKRTGMKQDEIVTMMAEETWIDAAEAVAMGFADSMTEPAKIENAAAFPLLAQYRHVPQALLENQHKNTLPTERELERLLTRDAGLSRSMARDIINHGLKPLHATRDAGGEETDELVAAINKAAETLIS